jgi:hypothetical protein
MIASIWRNYEIWLVRIAYLSNALTNPQFSNPLKPVIIQSVDQHVATSGEGFCRENDIIRFCTTDQLFFY